MILVVPKERAVDERRVALTPESVSRLIQQGMKVGVEKGAGAEASYSDEAFIAAGAHLYTDTQKLWQAADVIVKVRPPLSGEPHDEVGQMRTGTVLISFLNPLGDRPLRERLAEQGVTSFAMELIPRIARAQSMDALSSQASIAGYKAVLMAADHLGKFFPMLTTAAGTVRPANVFVLGAGVAGLQAIATARRLGANVQAFDIRSVVREQVESLGATFVSLEVEEETEGAGGYAKDVSSDTKAQARALITKQLKTVDVVITTALVPGKKAPTLIDIAMVEQMPAGSLVVDLAGEQGGNCELSEPNVEKEHHGVQLLAPLNLPARMPIHASQLYARNLRSLLELIFQEGQIRLDFADEIVNAACVTHEGRVRLESPS